MKSFERVNVVDLVREAVAPKVGLEGVLFDIWANTVEHLETVDEVLYTIQKDSCGEFDCAGAKTAEIFTAHYDEILDEYRAHKWDMGAETIDATAERLVMFVYDLYVSRWLERLWASDIEDEATDIIAAQIVESFSNIAGAEVTVDELYSHLYDHDYDIDIEILDTDEIDTLLTVGCMEYAHGTYWGRADVVLTVETVATPNEGENIWDTVVRITSVAAA